VHGPKDKPAGYEGFIVRDAQDRRFLDDLLAAGPVTAEEVAGWFADVRCVVDGSNPHVRGVAVLINMLAGQVAYGNEKVDAKLRVIGVSLANLRRHLPWLLRPTAPWVVREDGFCEVRHFGAILHHVKVLYAEARHRFPAPQGTQRIPWVRNAHALVEPIGRVLRSAGYRRPSPRQSGALVAVLCRALAAIDGEEYKPAKVKTFFDSRRKKDF
jgi:hypothetical protein